MTPRIAVLPCLLLALAACGASGDETAGPEAVPATWRMPPRVEAAERTAGALELTGMAEPGARVVLRQAGGEAHAVTAGADGAFLLRIPTGPGELSLQPQDQEGQDAVAGPDLIVALADGTVAALSPGAATRRLDSGLGLGAVDSDGRMAIVSGRTSRGMETSRVSVGGGPTMDVQSDARGIWAVRVNASTASAGVTVDGVAHQLGLSGAAPGAVIAAGSGRLIGWTAPDGAIMQTWLPPRR
jgi:hypothetical protein